jgi:hypothetical protein
MCAPVAGWKQATMIAANARPSGSTMSRVLLTCSSVVRRSAGAHAAVANSSVEPTQPTSNSVGWL